MTPRHALALVALAALLILNGCAGLYIAPADAPANAEDSQNRPAPTRSVSGNDAGEGALGDVTEQSSAGMPAAESEALDSDRAESAAPIVAAPSSGRITNSTGSGRTAPPADAPKRSDRYEPVTAGVVDDNEQWGEYLDYRDRHYRLDVNDRDVSERYIIFVQDENGFPVHDAAIDVYVDDNLVFGGRTDAGGRVLFHPLALQENPRRVQQTREFQVAAQKEWVAERRTFERYGAENWVLTLSDLPVSNTAQLDLLFLVDATGSMDDEIAKLKASMADIATQIDQLPEQPDVRYGLVHYRDRGDSYVVRSNDFTHNLNDFQRSLAALRANGGGDYPESVNEALHKAIHEMDWRTPERDGETLRLIVLVADAPPHLDYHWQRFSYDTDMIEAVGRGIKIFPVGASGLDDPGEYIFRQVAQFTGGKFVFLTYEDGDDPSSGPGTETSHDVENYSVNTLDRLIVRLVREELEKLTQKVAVESAVVAPNVAQRRPTPTSTPAPTRRPRPQPASCALNLDSGTNNCGGIVAIHYIDMERASRRHADGEALMMLTLDPRRTGYTRVRFDITYRETPNGRSVNIGDSISNSGYGGDDGDQSNDAEMQILEGALVVYGNDQTPKHQTTDGNRELAYFEDMVRQGETISLEISNERLEIDSPGGTETVDSRYLFALAGQPDREGRPNFDIFAAFNRTIADDRGGTGMGVSEVIVTVYPR
ncbi:VWA domain-containing protein [Chloroflexi bacterium TSY]|nr:VWA domain-containing protein [Chloroflexi bacterium TSY]